MALRQPTEEERRQIQQLPAEAKRTVIRPPTPEEITLIQQDRTGVTARMVKRALTTDIEDPMELERLSSVLAGSVGGGMAGSKVPVAPGPAGVFINPITGALVGGVAGAAAGAVAPEATLEAMEFMGLIPPGAREERALNNDQLARVVAGEALLETVFGVAGAATRLAGRGVSTVATGIGKEERRLAEVAAREGVELAPVQLGERGFGRTTVNVLGRFPFLGSAARRQAARSGEQFVTMKQNLPDRIGPLISSTEVGQRIFDEATTLVTQVSDDFGRRYEKLFLDAARAQFRVDPKATLEATGAVVDDITQRATTDVAGRAKKPSKAALRVRRFLQNEILGTSDDAVLGQQTLAQMDELLSKIDQEIASAPQEIRGQVARLLAPVKGAAKTDIVEHGTAPSAMIAETIGDRLARLDAEFSDTMRVLFETSTAKKFQSVRRQGLKGVVRASDEATRINIDRLAGIVVDLQSPQAIDELSRLVSPDTFKAVGARALADIIEGATSTTRQGTTISAARLAKEFGLVGKGGARKEALQRLFRDTPIDADTLTDIVAFARRMEASPIPDVSTFLARGATIGGGQAIINAVIPTLAVTGGAAAAGPVGAGLVGIMMFGGTRALIGALSDPKSARALSAVADQEASAVVRRAAWQQLVRFGLANVPDVGEEEVKAMVNMSKDVAKAIFPEGDQSE